MEALGRSLARAALVGVELVLLGLVAAAPVSAGTWARVVSERWQPTQPTLEQGAHRAIPAAVSSANVVPGERPITDPTMLHEVRMGVAWWTAHRVYGCPDGVAAGVAPDHELRADVGTSEDVEGLATVLAPHVGGCELVIARSIADIYRTYRAFEELDRTCRRRRQQFYCSDRVTVRTMRDAQEDRCSIIRHELGHAIGGLDDDEPSADPDVAQLMAQGGWNPVFDDCAALAVATWRFHPRRPTPTGGRGKAMTATHGVATTFASPDTRRDLDV